MTDNVFAVFSTANFSSSTPSTGSGSQETEKALVGIATDEMEAARLISQDHFKTLSDNGKNPLEFPLHKSRTEPDTYTILDVSEEAGTTYSTTIAWTVEQLATNALLNFEL